MSTATPQPGKGFRAWYKRQTRLGRFCFILTALVVLMVLLGRVSHLLELIFIGPLILCCLILSPLLIILLYRWVTRRFLWKVRNRLIVTYALMSLAPVVLCVMLFGIASYLFAGQFATNSALTLLDRAAAELRDETSDLALLSTTNGSHRDEAAAEPLKVSTLPISLAVLKGDTFQRPTAASSSANPFLDQPLPSWLKPGFHGVVAYKDHLYLAAFVAIPQSNRTLSIIGTRPLDKSTLTATTGSLGRVLLLPGSFSGKNRGKNSGIVNIQDDDDKSDNNNVNITIGGKNDLEKFDQADQERFDTIDTGSLPPQTHLFDEPIVFSAPLDVTSWENGDRVRSIVAVFSRPSILYGRLFSTTNGLGTVIRIILISVALFFGLLELFALLMAAGLSSTITRSVADLYRGTREIDAGHLEHRIVIKNRDQLGALAQSFNGMTASIVDLLAQQREKERLLSELSIAREVQANLFPHSPVALPGFEIHAVCQPARTVSGDYFDFIFGRHGNDLYLALGDISGKGISAALLMASLHSAVRAFGLSSSNGVAAEFVKPSPAKLLELLNKHIYGSTPPEKYATLFLAYYDSATRQLTYSNGGHLAPMILCGDGTVKHLDCGGPPVGLLNGTSYCEDTVELNSGDLLMAFSDGLTEPEHNEEQFGEERLFDYIREHRSEPLPTLATHTLLRLQDWIGSQEQPDDMTLLLARQL